MEREVGEVAPDFTLAATVDGGELRLAALRGAPAVIYFYPKDATPGCTTEACDFRDHFNGFAAEGVTVVGISPDSLASHERFRAKQGLNFPLASDPDHAVAQAYGVWQLKKLYGREYEGIVRTTFLVDANGRIARVWKRVKVKGHASEVLQAARELLTGEPA